MSNHPMNWIGSTVAFFVKSKVTPLILGFAIFLGIMAVVNLSREEEPQISVPMFDIFVRYPGATSEEVEQRIINVGERKLWEISGVEYIYSTAQADGAMIVVRFKVGEDVEKSLIKLYTKVFANVDILPRGASPARTPCGAAPALARTRNRETPRARRAETGNCPGAGRR